MAHVGHEKGCSYGTIVADLDRHRVVDLLPDRTVATLAGWLGQRSGIKGVARDRSTEYARGARLGASRLQVADRWQPAGQHAPGGRTLAPQRSCAPPAPAARHRIATLSAPASRSDALRGKA